MTDEQLQRANDLKASLKYCKEQLQKWNDAKALYDQSVHISPGPVWVKAAPESLTILKAINVQYYTDQIQKMEAEFSAL
jgi:anthranilate/para-aminobenzoate synthase component II